ncbi:MAG: hypothetical protein VX694_11975 [Planctomycetota bacterium]|nr:hypothetical protein [Planctomycetota bacterium]
MKKLVFASLALLCSSYTNAADLSSFGLESLTPISNEAATTVRGQGGSTLVRSVGTSSMAFSIVDPETGSIFNMNSTSQQSGHDGIEFVSADSGAQAVGNTAVGGIQFGDATFEMVVFAFSLSGFSAVTQAQQVAGPGKGLDFTSILQ